MSRSKYARIILLILSWRAICSRKSFWAHSHDGWFVPRGLNKWESPPQKKRSTKLGIEHSANGQKPKSLKSGAKADKATQIDLSLISRHGLMVSGTRKEFSTSSQIYLSGPHILIGQKSCPDIDIATWIVTREACF